jgi:hypothetical protein
MNKKIGDSQEAVLILDGHAGFNISGNAGYFKKNSEKVIIFTFS